MLELAFSVFGVAVFASVLVLAIFRWRVRRSLEREQSRTQTQSSPGLAPIDPEPIRREHWIPAQPDTIPSDARWHALVTEAIGHRTRLARVYMIASLGLAIAFAAIGTIVTADRSAPLLRFLYSAICFSTPLILIARLVYGRWTPWLVRVAIVVALLTVLSQQLLPFANEETGAAIITTASLVLLLHPRVRAAGPLALGFFTVVFLGSAVAAGTALFLWGMESRSDMVAQMTAIAESTQNLHPAEQLEAKIAFAQGYVPIMLQRLAVGMAVGLPISLVLGGLLVFRVSTAYTRKRTSDQWLVIASVWLFFAVAVTSQDSLAGLVANLACTAVGVFVVRFVWSRLPRSESPCLRLLLLRSFSLGERSNRLFQELETLWRGVGSVQLVGAADLAVSTLEPHELLDFLRGRSGRYFSHSESDVDRRLASFDYATDPDTRFRVNEILPSGLCVRNWMSGQIRRRVTYRVSRRRRDGSRLHRRDLGECNERVR
jgi:hypothetical protein